MERTLRHTCLLSIILVSLPVFAEGVTGQSLGPEFCVNEVADPRGSGRALAFDGAGNVIVVWTAYDADGLGVYGRRYDSALSALGTEFLVNTSTDDHQLYPDVSANGPGDFVVAWVTQQPGCDYCLGFQRYDGAGNPVGGETLINNGIETYGLKVVLTDTGDFEILFHIDYPGYAIGEGFDGDNDPCPGMLFQTTDRFSFCGFAGNREGDVAIIFTLGGTPRASHGRVCGSMDPDVSISSLGSAAMNSNGEVVIVWDSYNAGTRDLLAQRYDAGLSPVGGQLTIKSGLPNVSYDVKAALLDNGDFLAVWDELDGGPGSSQDVIARYYVAPDSFLEEFRVNENSEHNQSSPVVAASDDGRFLVVWSHLTDLRARGVWRVGTGVESEAPSISGHALSQNYPNPFVHNTVIQYRLAAPADVVIRIFDVQGKLVASIPQGFRVAGPHNAVWNGRDARGNRVSSGTYFYELNAGGKALTKKMILLK